MELHRCLILICPRVVSACLLAGMLTGCTVVGPTALRSGRLAYNEAIIETDNQQMLLAVVRNRYGENSNLLAVASVTANVTVTTSSGIQLGFGDDDSYAGNLVPLAVGAVYEENPTISYVPVGGARYAEQLLSPIPLAVLARLTATLADPTYIYGALVASANGIQNPDFVFFPDDRDTRFSRFALIMTRLTQAQRLHWIEDLRHTGHFSIVIDRYAPAHTDDVDELLNLLGLPAPENRSTQIVLPVSLALHGRESDAVGITTRSVVDLMEMLSAAVELPQADQRTGVAVTYPPAGAAGSDLRVRYSTTKPERAAVAVQYRDGWFYIAETDQAAKQFFRLMAMLWSATMVENAARGSAAPVLTVPVSR